MKLKIPEDIVMQTSMHGLRQEANRNVQLRGYMQHCLGRIFAIESINPSIENVGNHNEARFLSDEYCRRHGKGF